MEKGFYCISQDVKIIKHDEQYLLANPKIGTWVKISANLFDLIVSLSQKTSDSIGDLIHSMSGKFCVSENDIWDTVHRLEEMGLLIDKAKIRQEIPAGSRHIIFAVTNACNLKCSFCSNIRMSDSRHHDVRLPTEMGLKQIEHVARILALSKTPTGSITVSGGEPIMRGDLPEILCILKSMTKANIGLNTNGTLWTKEICKLIVRHVDAVTVSIDGSKPEVHDKIRGVGTFRKAIDCIKHLQDAGLGKIGIRAVICKQNIDDIPNLMSLAKELNCAFHANGLMKSGNAAENSEIVCTEPHENKNMRRMLLERRLQEGCLAAEHIMWIFNYARSRCQAIHRNLYIDADGSLYPCNKLATDEYGLGNLAMASDLESLIESSPITALIDSYDIDNKPGCRGCDVRYFCAGGCIADDIAREKDGLTVDCDKESRDNLVNLLWNWRDDMTLEESLALALDGPSLDLMND